RKHGCTRGHRARLTVLGTPKVASRPSPESAGHDGPLTRTARVSQKVDCPDRATRESQEPAQETAAFTNKQHSHHHRIRRGTLPLRSRRSSDPCRCRLWSKKQLSGRRYRLGP